MIEQENRVQNYYMKRKILSEVGDSATGEEVLDYLIGDESGRGSDYFVGKYEYSQRTLFNRLNLIWVWPLFLVSIPFRWIFTGSIGVTRGGRVWQILDRLIKIE